METEHFCLHFLSPIYRCLTRWTLICCSNFKSLISEHILLINFMSSSYKISPGWIPQNTIEKESTLVQVMAWCHQVTNHYLSKCWSRFMWPHVVTWPQWVNGAKGVMMKNITWEVRVHMKISIILDKHAMNGSMLGTWGYIWKGHYDDNKWCYM